MFCMCWSAAGCVTRRSSRIEVTQWTLVSSCVTMMGCCTRRSTVWHLLAGGLHFSRWFPVVLKSTATIWGNRRRWTLIVCMLSPWQYCYLFRRLFTCRRLPVPLRRCICSFYLALLCLKYIHLRGHPSSQNLNTWLSTSKAATMDSHQGDAPNRMPYVPVFGRRTTKSHMWLRQYHWYFLAIHEHNHRLMQWRLWYRRPRHRVCA